MLWEIMIIIIFGIYIALYRDAQSALQHFVGDFVGELSIFLTTIGDETVCSGLSCSKA